MCVWVMVLILVNKVNNNLTVIADIYGIVIYYINITSEVNIWANSQFTILKIQFKQPMLHILLKLVSSWLD